jgi:uncharacterized protein YndB with AHSA1/START domain
MRITNSLTIDCSPRAVFAYLADFENLPRWNYAIRETRKITTGPVNVGSRYRQSRAVPVRSEQAFEVTEFEPDRALTIRGSFGPFPAEISYALYPEGNATALTNTVDLQPPRSLSLVAPIATHRIKSAVAANLNVLKRTLERA